MATRTYDIELECGCMFSADGGGGMIPCSGYFADYLGDDSSEEIEKHKKAMTKWFGSKEQREYQKECIERNR